MSIRLSGILTAGSALAVLTFALPAHALSERECSVKYQAAKSAGALGGMKWNDFRKAQCGTDASAAMPAPAAAPVARAPAAPTVAPTPAPRSSSSWFGNAAPTVAPTPAPRASSSWFGNDASRSYARVGDAQFPMGVSPRYAGESIGKARMHTCLDQYRINKANGGNGALKWIQKGGGYYSECNKRLGGR